MNKIIGIIPARYGSTRFPGKLLLTIKGKTMVRLVYENATKTVENVWIATDDERIYNEMERFGGNVVMTSIKHESGTDRCSEAIDLIERKTSQTFDIVLNIQGDEPFLEREQLEQLIKCFEDEKVQIATLIKKIENLDDLLNENRPKVLINKQNEAIYFSRSAIPFIQGEKQDNWLKLHTFYKHIGLYGFRKNILQEITKLPKSTLEMAEKLEQLRWIEHCYKIKVDFTDKESICIDNEDDLKKIK